MGGSAGWLLVAAGLLLVLAGLLAVSGAFSWFGRLPGDLRIGGEGDAFRAYIPITSMLLISLAITLVLSILRRFF